VTVEGVSAEHTSVPRWPTEPPTVDPTGRAYLVISRGDAAGAVAAEWAREIRAIGRPLWIDHRAAGDAAASTLLRRQLGTARVGLRLMVAGPELEVLDVLRIARAAGAIEAEWRAHVTAVPARRVQCTHCHQHTIGAVSVGDTIRCGGCTRSLVVYHHVSRAHGAYMGYMVDAEEPS
jgi:dimethylamine monooxygenase subunit C